MPLTSRKVPMFLNHADGVKAIRVYRNPIDIDNELGLMYFKPAGKFSAGYRKNERKDKLYIATPFTFVMPAGAKHHQFDKTSIVGLCNLRRQCMGDLVETLLQFKKERDDIMDDYHTECERHKDIVKDLKDRLSKLENKTVK